MGALKDCKIIKNKTVSATVFEGLFEDKTFLDVVYDTPKDYIKQCWDAYKRRIPKVEQV